MFEAVTQIIDVGIGLIFVFLLVSLIVKQINDKLSEWLQMRAKGLEEGLRNFVVGGKVGNTDLLKSLYENPLVKSLVPEDAVATNLIRKIPFGIGDKFIRTNPDPTANTKEKAVVAKPVNISAQTFATVLLDSLIPNKSGQTKVDALLVEVNKLDPKIPLRDPIVHIIATTADDINKVRTNIEQWYDDVMVKTTKAYQAHMWRIALTLSFAIALVFNVDTISIARVLWNDSSLRAALTTEASAYAKTDADQKNALKKLDGLGLPIGWVITNDKQFCWAATDWFPRPQAGVGVAAPVNDPCKWPPLNFWYDGVLKALGWIITAFAGAQGAPFWFDILKKATNR